MTKNKGSAGGDALKTIREAAGLSQRELAERTGMSSSLVQMIEIGQRNITPLQAHKIAAHTGCNPMKLLEGRLKSADDGIYSGSVYEQWERTELREEEIKKIADQVAKTISLLILAASKGEVKAGTTPTRRVREVTSLVLQNVLENLQRFDMEAIPEGRDCAHLAREAVVLSQGGKIIRVGPKPSKKIKKISS